MTIQAPSTKTQIHLSNYKFCDFSDNHMMDILCQVWLLPDFLVSSVDLGFHKGR